MKKLCAFLALVIVLTMTMTIIPVSAADTLTFALTDAGTEEGFVKVKVSYTPLAKKVGAATLKITYDPTLLSTNLTDDVFAENGAPTGPDESNTPGVVLMTAVNPNGYRGNIDTIWFAIKENANGMATFKIEEVRKLTDNNAVAYDYNIENASVTIQIGDGGSSEPDPEPEVFAISATESGNDVVVTVENADLAVGEEIKVYVATYTDGDVLVTCQEQALVEGTMTFTGLANANAKVFVWDNQNVPVANVTIQ